MDNETLKILVPFIGGIIILLALNRFVLKTKPKKCSVCDTDAHDIYTDNNGIRVNMCRNHLIERWKKDFVSSTYNMVMIEPDFDLYPLAYLYGTPDKLIAWEYPEEAKENILSILDKIKGQMCKECRNQATISFFKKEDYKFPFLEKLSATPTYLCKNCSLNKVEPLIRNASKPFSEGVYAPTDGYGIYHAQEF